jgi:hypothetical protein
VHCREQSCCTNRTGVLDLHALYSATGLACRVGRDGEGKDYDCFIGVCVGATRTFLDYEDSRKRIEQAKNILARLN